MSGSPSLNTIQASASTPNLRRAQISGAPDSPGSQSPSTVQASASTPNIRRNLSVMRPRQLSCLTGDDLREAIREDLVERGGGNERQAFRTMDLSGSGSVSFSEFEHGLDRLNVHWRQLTGLRKSREVFNLFDSDRSGSLSLRKLFPRTAAEEERVQLNTPDFYKQWCRRTRDLTAKGMPRGSMWTPSSFDEERKIMEDNMNRMNDADIKKNRMRGTFWRLKSRGKSDARCREVVALHLPRGTGPVDREDCALFCEKDVMQCRKVYNEKINEPVKKIQKVVGDMRGQRMALQDSKRRLLTLESVRMPEERRASVVPPAASLLGDAFKNRSMTSKSLRAPDDDPP